MLLDFLNRMVGLRRGVGYQRAFLSRRQFEREVTRERIRASRRGIPFCIVSLTIVGDADPTRATKVGRMILRNLRVTDEKAMFSHTDFAVLLVDTARDGGRSVVDRLTELFAKLNLRVDMELKVHDPSSFEPRDSNPVSTGASNSRWEDNEAAGILSVGASNDRAAWTDSKVWRTSDNSNVERRGSQRFSDSDSISQRGDEIVSSDDPLVQSSALAGLVKRSIDIVGASIGLLLVGPFLLIAMAVIRLTSPGDSIFKQTREGFRGKPFTIYKLRTMVADAELSQQALRELSHRDGPAFKIDHDPRVTKVGKFLRATCVDELPQLLNVLRGDMSIVGPRPLPWHESRACSHWHRRRLDVRPGLTCFWQINKASVESFDDWMRLDLEYVDRGTLLIDALLIYRTFSVALMGRGSH